MKRTCEQVIWDFVQGWLLEAQAGMRAAEHLLGIEQDDYSAVAFHAQQAAEKLLKALLVRHQIPFPKTHDIAQLLELVAQSTPSLCDELAPAALLTPFGVEFRYPGEETADAGVAARAVHEA